jgi:hypothetical protein
MGVLDRHARLEPLEPGGVVDRDELGGRMLEPAEQVSDDVDVERLEARISLGGGRHLRDVELVVDVAVQPEARALDRRDRLSREHERDWHVPEEATASRLGHDSALVADDGVVEPRLLDVGPHRPEHPSSDDEDADPGGPRRADGCERPLTEDEALGKERPVEVARERLHLAWKLRRKAQPRYCWRNATRSASSWSSSFSP